MDPLTRYFQNNNRREFLKKMGFGIGGLALGYLLDPFGFGKNNGSSLTKLQKGSLALPHFAPKAKRLIYLFQSGGPSQLDLFDYKPKLNENRGMDLPESVRMGQRLTGMTSGQATFPLTGSVYDFAQYGESRAWLSELLPYIGKIADELCFVKSMHTEAINHDPAITFFQTGSQLPGRPSFGSWMSYGLGSLNDNLPSFIVMLSKGTGREVAQPLYSRLWGNGFLSSLHQGVQFRAGKDPVLYLNNPEGVSRLERRKMLDYLAQINQHHEENFGDQQILDRMAQYEMAYRMQTSVPEVMDIENEPDAILQMYGPDSLKPGTYAANCILARRLIEKDVRFVQLYHVGWDQHANLPAEVKRQAKDVDQPTAALILDLKQRGLLEDTLVIWGGEFGRTNYSQGILTDDDYGRDHHPRCFTIFMAGGGIQPGMTYGQTDELGYNIVQDPMHVHDLQATILHLFGIDHEQMTYKYQGRRFRLTDVHGHVHHQILA
ncbi:MAG: DUF1501 domain-containing protein [Flavobacteriaceae bacterium]|nr:DUF1501 domain-containing protein [Flavobacteriaceae bacterium]MCY4268043.1 DUF1501 domain-containing protein [Flavobacteriaceae bacterium]MCY4298612.1 DUF1501 domain-containing protein [Flavobacteriaceae bacterium]